MEMMKPLENIKIEFMPGCIRVHADVTQKRGYDPLPMYADKHLCLSEDMTKEEKSARILCEAKHACMDLLGHRYGDGLHGPWQKVYWAYQGDISRQIKASLQEK